METKLPPEGGRMLAVAGRERTSRGFCRTMPGLCRQSCADMSPEWASGGAMMEAVAAEVFQDAVIEALAHADRFTSEMQPRAWFLAIAANILKRHRASYAKRYKFEVL